MNENGEKITGSKSDILMDVEYEDGTKERIGISAKACSNNAQLALTTVSAFCEMLKENGMHISENAEIGLKMFCGEDGYRPKDSYKPTYIIHEYPYFGFIQFQPIGNQQNFSELQFNLKSKYYNKFKELLDKEKDEVREYDDFDR